MNKLTLIGRLARDPEIRWTTGENSKAVANFSIAVTRRSNKDKTDFFDCVAWGKLAEHMEKYWHKGMKAGIVGRIEKNEWTDKDGGKRSKVEVIVEEIEFVEPKKETAPAEDGGFADIPEGDEDLPFRF